VGSLKNLALVLASMIFCLGVLEIVLRILNGLPAIPDRNLILERAHTADINSLIGVEYDPVLGWVQQSNVRFNPENRNISFTTGEYGVRMNQPEIRAIPKTPFWLLAIRSPPARRSEILRRGRRNLSLK
jgi:hypothetical protein